jgi:hypothetical protein
MWWQRSLASNAVPKATVWFDDAAVAALRTRQFDTFWQSVVALRVEDYSVRLAYDRLAREVATASRTQGRAAAYVLAAQCIEVLAQDAAAQTVRVGPESIAFLRGLLSRLAGKITDPSLLRDIAALLEQRMPSETAAERALLDAAARRAENPDDPSTLERVDPDIAIALERMVGTVSELGSETSTSRGKRDGKSQRKK